MKITFQQFFSVCAGLGFTIQQVAAEWNSLKYFDRHWKNSPLELRRRSIMALKGEVKVNPQRTKYVIAS